MNNENVGAGLVSAQKNKITKPNANAVGGESISTQIKSSHAITLIALIITIIIMLILAGVVLSLTIGEHGIFGTATNATEEYEKAKIKEEIQLAIMDIQGEEIAKGNELTLETLKDKLSSKLDTMPSINGSNIEGEYKGYDYEINDKFEIAVKDVAVGEKPNIECKVSSTEITIGSIDVEVIATISEGAVTIEEPEGITVKNVISSSNKIFTITKNGEYTFTAVSESGRKNRKTVKINNIVEKPEIEITEIEDNSFKVNILNIKAEDTYDIYVNNTVKVSDTKEKENVINGLTKGTTYKIYVALKYNSQKINSEVATITTTNTTESLGKILLTPNGFVNANKKDPVTNEIIGKVLDKSISQYSLTTLPWKSGMYEALYNAFDGNPSTAGRIGANELNNTKSTKGGYIEVEEACWGKYLNVYGGFTIQLIFRNSSEAELKSVGIGRVSAQIFSYLIPDGTKFIEIYNNFDNAGGTRGSVYEIFLTDNEVTSEQSINDFLNN